MAATEQYDQMDSNGLPLKIQNAVAVLLSAENKLHRFIFAKTTAFSATLNRRQSINVLFSQIKKATSKDFKGRQMKVLFRLDSVLQLK